MAIADQVNQGTPAILIIFKSPIDFYPYLQKSISGFQKEPYFFLCKCDTVAKV
jgi:hypothetical protein